MLIDRIIGAYLKKGESYGNHNTEHTSGYQAKDVMKDLLGRLDEAIDDMEQGRVRTIEEVWVEIDAI